MKESLIKLEIVISSLTKSLESYSKRPDASQSSIDYQNKLISELVDAYNQFEHFEPDPLALAISKEIRKFDPSEPDGYYITVRHNTSGKKYPFIYINNF
jgi:hypothetical protein